MFCCSVKKKKQPQKPNSDRDNIPYSTDQALSSKQVDTQKLQVKHYVISGEQNEEMTSTNMTNLQTTKDENNISADSCKVWGSQVLIQTPDIIEKVKRFKKKPNKDEEKQFIARLIGQNSARLNILDRDWANQYSEYLSKEKQPSPGPITNQKLCNSNQMLYPNLMEEKDYVLVNEHVWNFISLLYGGGPELKQPFILLTPKDSQSIRQHNDEESQSQIKKSSAILRQNGISASKNSSIEPQRTPQIEEARPFQNTKSMTYRELQPIGLKNARYYCYLNSVIQCLMGVPQLNYWVLANKDKIKSKKNIARYLELLLMITNIKPNQQVASASVLYYSKFDAHEQHDSQEFLLFLLASWQDDLKSPLPKSKEKLPEPKSSLEALQMYQQKFNTVVDQIFVGQLTYTIKCKHCQYLSQAFEPFFDLSIPIDKGLTRTATSIQDCLKLYFQEDLIDGPWECEKCKKKSTKLQRTCVVSHSPNVLILNLKRFAYHPRSQKIKDPVQALLNLDISKFCGAEVQGTKYNLTGLIIHQGGLDSGHYQAMVQKAGRWYLFDDEVVTKISAKDIEKTTSAYIFFYEKQP